MHGYMWLVLASTSRQAVLNIATSENNKFHIRCKTRNVTRSQLATSHTNNGRNSLSETSYTWDHDWRPCALNSHIVISTENPSHCRGCLYEAFSHIMDLIFPANVAGCGYSNLLHIIQGYKRLTQVQVVGLSNMKTIICYLSLRNLLVEFNSRNRWAPENILEKSSLEHAAICVHC